MIFKPIPIPKDYMLCYARVKPFTKVTKTALPSRYMFYLSNKGILWGIPNVGNEIIKQNNNSCFMNLYLTSRKVVGQQTVTMKPLFIYILVHNFLKLTVSSRVL